MAAPLDNDNAEKWTLDDAIALFEEAFILSEEKESYLVGKETIEGWKHDFIGELIDSLRVKYKDTNKKIYRKLLASHLPSRFEQLTHRWEDLKEKMEVNCYSNTKKGIINTATGIINLKSNHNWKDRTSNEHTVKQEQPLFGDE
jgi:hypothetical protein